MAFDDTHADRIAGRTKATSLLAAGTQAQHTERGWEVTVTLDALMVKIRGAEQGRKDLSITAALADHRIHQALEVVRRCVNASLPAGDHIARIRIVEEPLQHWPRPEPAPSRSQRELVVASLTRGA
jgi:hypothetical protein